MSRETVPYYCDCPYVRFDGVRIHYETFASDGFPLVMLHGLTMTNFTWSGNVEALSRKSRVIAVEHMGFGDRTAMLRHGYRIDNLMGATFAVMDHLGIERADVMGTSLGGGLALLMAATHPERVRRLVLIDPAAYPAHWPLHLGLFKIPFLGDLAALLTPSSFFGMITVRCGWARARHQQLRYVREYAEVFKTLAGRLALLKTTRALPPCSADTLVDAYRSVTAPTLIIWGRKDPLLPVSMGRRLARDLSNATLHVIDNAAHSPHEEFPELVNELITEWLAGR